MTAEKLNDILNKMKIMRSNQGGSDWDRQQNFQTIIPYTLEETYELIDAIEKNDPKEIQSELGDLFYQIVYYSQMANEAGWFAFNDVLQTLKEKLEKRHGEDFSQDNWEKVKKAERLEKHGESVLSGIPLALPGLVRSQKLQKRAAEYGFDWPNIQSVINKLKEELIEFEEAIHSDNTSHAVEELGDLLFVCANLARHLKIDAETVMRQANRKFEQRFEGVAKLVSQSGQAWESFDLDALEQFWQQVKKQQGT